MTSELLLKIYLCTLVVIFALQAHPDYKQQVSSLNYLLHIFCWKNNDTESNINTHIYHIKYHAGTWQLTTLSHTNLWRVWVFVLLAGPKTLWMLGWVHRHTQRYILYSVERSSGVSPPHPLPGRQPNWKSMQLKLKPLPQWLLACWLSVRETGGERVALGE